MEKENRKKTKRGKKEKNNKTQEGKININIVWTKKKELKEKEDEVENERDGVNKICEEWKNNEEPRNENQHNIHTQERE